MAKKDEEFLKKLLATFKTEAEEHARSITSGLVKLEKASTEEKRLEIIEVLFREAHSLKGSARAVNQVEIETLCQSLESLFAAWKRGEINAPAELFDVLHRAVDVLEKILSSPEAEQTVEEKSRLAALTRRLESTDQGAGVRSEVAGIVDQQPKIRREKSADGGPRSPSPHLAETVRVSTARLDSLLFQAEELVSAKLTANHRAAELREIIASFGDWKQASAKIKRQLSGGRNQPSGADNQNPTLNRRSLKPDARSLMSEFIEQGNSAMAAVEKNLVMLSDLMEQDRRTLGQLVDNLLEDTKSVLMLPFSWLLAIVPKIVRDLSRAQAKDVELVVEGGEIEVDRRILQEMREPLIHLVRNSIDHGLESSSEREKKKKSPRGRITIAITQRDSKVEILVSDDGAGIELIKIREAAFRLGVPTGEALHKLTDQETLSLVFRSGISTSPMITDISGRGLGLAIVRERVEKLGGSVSVETQPSAGTSFRLILPTTLATFRGVLVQADEQMFVLPAASVERAARVNKTDIRTVENRETVWLDGKAIALARLGDVLKLPRKTHAEDSGEKAHVVVLGAGEKWIGFLVDGILQEQEVLVKSLGKQLSRVRNIAGATVLATGRVVPVINVSDLMKSAVRLSATPIKQTAAPGEKEEAGRKSVLVVEDSITARALVKNILEAAGYEVATAVDGIDGFTKVRSGQFNIVVSDVDMPRMNGFDLTAKIRADKKLSELPVVLVTALESREDRERGIEVGANAYIVKSSFDQSNLLEVIRRLI